MASKRRSRRRRSSSSCGRGKIRRKSYRTRRGSYYPSTCIKDRGAPGRGRKILPTPTPGGLYPYKEDLPATERHRILKRLARRDGVDTIIRRVNLIRNYATRGSARKRLLTSDLKYVQKLGRGSSRRRSRRRSRR